ESLTVARAGHDQAQAEFTQARVALETCQRELADVSAQLEAQRRTAAAATAERDRLDQRLRELERRLAVAQERRVILQARHTELMEEVRAVEFERERANSVVSAEDENRAKLEKSMSEAKGVIGVRQAQ